MFSSYKVWVKITYFQIFTWNTAWYTAPTLDPVCPQTDPETGGQGSSEQERPQGLGHHQLLCNHFNEPAWTQLCSSVNPILISLSNSHVICFKKKKFFLKHFQLAVNWEMFSCNRPASFGSSAERLASLKKLSYHVWKISAPAKVPDWHFLTYKLCCILTTLFSISSRKDSFGRLWAKICLYL